MLNTSFKDPTNYTRVKANGPILCVWSWVRLSQKGGIEFAIYFHPSVQPSWKVPEKFNSGRSVVGTDPMRLFLSWEKSSRRCFKDTFPPFLFEAITFVWICLHGGFSSSQRKNLPGGRPSPISIVCFKHSTFQGLDGACWFPFTGGQPLYTKCATSPAISSLSISPCP